MQAGTPSDPRLTFISQLDLASSRVEFSAAPIVLLCGGKVREKERPEDDDPPVQSLRHAFVNRHTEYEVFRPEEITTWHTDGIFKNLMDFEADLASICSLVVIILESPGAIAELGAFSQLEDLSKRIIAIKSSCFDNDISFINLGILRYISRDHASGVKTYPWDVDKPELITTEVLDDLDSDIQEELDKQVKAQALKITNNSHVVVVICELIALFVALKENEILSYLEQIGILMKPDELKRKLFLLEKFRVIKKQTYSDSVFYLQGSGGFHRVRLKSKQDATAIDALRINMECNEFYRNSDKHRSRARAIKQASGGAGL